MFKIALPALTLAIGLAACGGSSGSSSSASATSSATTTASAASGAVAIAAQPSGQLAFTQTSLTAKAGTLKISFTDKSPVSHNLTLQKGTSGAVVGATPTFAGGSRTLSVKLAPGTYTFFCSVPGHRMAGMQGTLTVQ